MSTLRTIKRRIRSVQSTQQITRAMEMVAAARLTRARRDVEAARPYAETMTSMLGHLAGAAGRIEHPLFEPREVGARVVVVFSSDRGLAGPFNANVIRHAERFAKTHRDEGVQLVFIGRKAWDFFRRRDYEILKLWRDIGAKVELPLARAVTDYLLELFMEGGAESERPVRSVHLLYTQFLSTVSRRTVDEQLLDIKPPADPAEVAEVLPGAPPPSANGGGRQGGSDYIFEPSAAAIFEELLPRYALTRVVSAMLESFASEHSARMVAMSSASKNAEEMIDGLVLQRNRIRQAVITKEIAELVGGAEALA